MNVRVRGIPVATAIALIARANGIDPAKALEMNLNNFAAAMAAARKRKLS